MSFCEEYVTQRSSDFNELLYHLETWKCPCSIGVCLKWWEPVTSLFNEHPRRFWCRWCWENAYVKGRPKMVHLWNSETPVSLLPWKVDSLASTVDLIFRAWGLPHPLMPQHSGCDCATHKAAAILSLAPHKVYLSALPNESWSFHVAAGKASLVLKLHTLWPHPPHPLLHQLIQANSGSLIWSFLPTLLQMWERDFHSSPLSDT